MADADEVSGLGIFDVEYERIADAEHRVTASVWGGSVNACGVVRFQYPTASEAVASYNELRAWRDAGLVVRMRTTDTTVTLELEGDGEL